MNVCTYNEMCSCVCTCEAYTQCTHTYVHMNLRTLGFIATSIYLCGSTRIVSHESSKHLVTIDNSHVCLRRHTTVCTYTHTHKHPRAYTHRHTHAHTHACTHADTHAHTHVHIHTQLHTYLVLHTCIVYYKSLNPLRNLHLIMYMYYTWIH